MLFGRCTISLHRERDCRKSSREMLVSTSSDLLRFSQCCTNLLNLTFQLLDSVSELCFKLPHPVCILYTYVRNLPDAHWNWCEKRDRANCPKTADAPNRDWLPPFFVYSGRVAGNVYADLQGQHRPDSLGRSERSKGRHMRTFQLPILLITRKYDPAGTLGSPNEQGVCDLGMKQRQGVTKSKEKGGKK